MSLPSRLPPNQTAPTHGSRIAILVLATFGLATGTATGLCATALAEGAPEAVGTRPPALPTLALPALEVFADRAEEAAGLQLGLDAGTLLRLDADRAAEALNTLPGVNIQMNSGMESLIALRSPVLTGGAGQGSVLLLENGVPIRGAAFGNVNALFELPLTLASGVEVVAGPGSAAQGSNAVHGLINLALPLPSPGAGSSLRASVSSLARSRIVAGAHWPLGGDAALPRQGKGAVWAGASLTTEGGWRQASGLTLSQLASVLSLPVEAADLLAWVSVTALDQETAGFVQGPRAYRDRDLARQNPTPQAFRDARAIRVAARWTQPLAGAELSLTPFARWQDMALSQHFLIYQGTETNDSGGLGMLARLEGEAGALVWRVGADIDVSTGTLREVQDLPSFGDFPQGVHYDYAVETEQLGLWAEARWQIAPALALETGLRAEALGYDYDTRAPVGTFGRFRVVADRRDDYEVLTPKLGLVWQATPDLTAFARLARGARAPQASDLYRLQNRQNPGEIKVETLDSLELGTRFVGRRLSVQLAAWTQDKANIFFRDADGRNVPDGATRSVGVDLVAEGKLHEQLGWQTNVAWADHRYDFDRPVLRAEEAIRKGDTVDTAPDWLIDASLSYAPDERQDWRLAVEHVGRYVTNAANTAEYPGHTIWHLSGRYRIAGPAGGQNAIELFASVRNLFDLAYADRADFAFGSERYFPGEPRTLTIGVRVGGG